VDERELTKLWYLAAGIVRAPTQWSKAFQAIESNGSPPSQDLLKSLRALREALERHPSRSRDMDWLRTVAQELLSKGAEPSKDAGRALAWALENRSRTAKVA
jgi:hypothetical protein